MIKPNIIILLGCVLFFCCGMGDRPQDAPLSDKISSALYQLATANDPQAFAKVHGIPLIGNSVKVVILLKNNDIGFLARYKLTGIKEDKNLVEAIVPVRSLISLSEEEDVSYIRRPRKFWF